MRHHILAHEKAEGALDILCENDVGFALFLELHDVHIVAIDAAQGHDGIDRRARQERRIYADDAADAFLVEQRHIPNDNATPIVPAEHRVVDSIEIQQSGHVVRQMLHVVLIDGRRPARQTKAALIGRQNAVARIRQCRNLMPPGIRKFGKAVAEYDGHTDFRAGLVNRHIDAIGLDHGRRWKRSHIASQCAHDFVRKPVTASAHQPAINATPPNGTKVPSVGTPVSAIA